LLTTVNIHLDWTVYMKVYLHFSIHIERKALNLSKRNGFWTNIVRKTAILFLSIDSLFATLAFIKVIKSIQYIYFQAKNILNYQ